MCENTGSILKDYAEERIVSYGNIPSLNDLLREVTEVLKKIKFDSQLFAISEILPFKNARKQTVKQEDEG